MDNKTPQANKTSGALRMIPGGRDQPETEGSLALKRTDHEPGDPVLSLSVDRAENGYVLRTRYPEGDERTLIYAPHMKEKLYQDILARL
jgi:hypothetical protein